MTTSYIDHKDNDFSVLSAGLTTYAATELTDIAEQTIKRFPDVEPRSHQGISSLYLFIIYSQRTNCLVTVLPRLTRYTPGVSDCKSLLTGRPLMS